jgi:hypothetical protein
MLQDTVHLIVHLAQLVSVHPESITY